MSTHHAHGTTASKCDEPTHHRTVRDAAGGFILVSRAAYEGVGGHEAMRHELVDDQMLAIRLKAAGTPLALAGSAGRMRVRMYVGARETLRGWRKTPRPAWVAP